MKVVFLEDVPGKGEAGEIKEVANGFARNYLIPQKLAALATPEQIKRVDILRRVAAQRQARAEEEMLALGERLKEMTLTIKAKAGPSERLYGSVTSAVIAQELSKLLGRQIDRRSVVLDEPLRRLGRYQVSVRLSQDMAHSVTTVIEPEEKAKVKEVVKIEAKPKITRSRRKAEAASPEAEPAEKIPEVAEAEIAPEAPTPRRRKVVGAEEAKKAAEPSKRKRLRKTTTPQPEASAALGEPQGETSAVEAVEASGGPPTDQESTLERDPSLETEVRPPKEPDTGVKGEDET